MKNKIKLTQDHLNVVIEEGELVSFTKGDHEYIHQKGSPGWSSADTEMFPIIGPVDEAGFQVQVPRGNAIQDQHGLLRQFPYEFISATETKVVFKKSYKAGTPIKNSKYPEKSPKQWLVWPYSFEFEKRFHLLQDSLQIDFIVSGERDMPYMLGYHPAFKLHTNNPQIIASDRTITLDEVLAVGSRALQVTDCEELILRDKKELTISTEGFGHFMCWTEVDTMVCIEPISFYPYAVSQRNLHEGFRYLQDSPANFTVLLKV